MPSRTRTLHTSIVTILIASCLPTAAQEYSPLDGSPEGLEAFRLLEAYYEDEGRNSIVEEPLARLRGDDSRTLGSATQLLFHILQQSVEDERGGRAPRPHPVPWIREPSLTEQVRLQIAKGIRGAEDGELARWLLFQEPSPVVNIGALETIRAGEGEARDALLWEILELPHPNERVLSRAFEALALAPEPRLEEIARRLSLHHFRQVRTSARRFLKERRIPFEQEFQPLAAVRGFDGIRKLLARMNWLEVPESRTWVRAVVPTAWAGEVEEVAGWLISERDGAIRVRTYFCEEIEIPAATAFSRDETFDATVDRVLEIKEAFSNSRDIDEKRKLDHLLRNQDWTYTQGRQWETSLCEIQLIAWAYQIGDIPSVARLLLPIVEDFGDERAFPVIAQWKLGERRENEMLHAFVHRRDYASTQQIAQDLLDPAFEGSIDRRWAEALSTLLPRRAADFRELRLPDHGRWTQLRRTLSRGDQIRFLCERLRLLNTVQRSQPGGVEYEDPQYSCTLDEYDKLRHAEGRSFEVINPYLELEVLDLSFKELGLVLPYLECDDYLLAYDLYRFGGGIQSLHRLSWVVAWYLHEATCRDRRSFPGFGSLSTENGRVRFEAAIREQIEARPDARRGTLLLEEARVSGDLFRLWDIGLELLVIERGNDYLDILLARPDSPIPSKELVDLIWLLDRTDLMPTVESWIPTLDEGFRAAQANCFVLLHSISGSASSAAARDRFKEELRGESGLYLADLIIESLIEGDDSQLLKSIEDRLFEGDADRSAGFHAAQLLFVRGNTRAREFLLGFLESDALDDETRETRRKSIVRSISEWLEPEAAFGEDPGPEARVALATHLRASFEAIVAGRGGPPRIEQYIAGCHSWISGVSHLRWVRSW